MAQDAPDIFGMSDEDFIKNSGSLERNAVEAPPAASAANAEGVQAVETPVVAEAPAVEGEQVPENNLGEADESEDEIELEVNGETVANERDSQGRFKKAPKVETPAVVDSAGSKAPVVDLKAATTQNQGENPAAAAATAATTTETPPNYEELYKTIMTPFKANGRTIELKDPKEAVQLMQMGANYTKKMQELVPHRKMLTMLQNNGLLDEDKISYLIDLDKKNPEAIKKLVKDAGIDPTDIDTSVEPAYRQGNHRVSDQQVAFQSALEDMQSTPERTATLRAINDGWDQASKEALWSNPSIMTVIHGQRENGIYDRIANEVARRQMINEIAPSIPFLQAYKVVGDEMSARNAFADLLKAPTASATAAPVTPAPVVATRVAAPKPAADNQRAAAASTNRSASRTRTPLKNPLEMSDEDFLKQFAGRV